MSCKLFILLLSISYVYFPAKAQVAAAQDSVQRYARIHVVADDNKVRFNAETPPLNQIAGAPAAFYTYFWEFGDGQHSFEESPTHVYKEAGEYKADLWVTNNYDNGKPPPSRPQQVSINNASYSPDDNLEASLESDFVVRKIREPVPNEEMVVIMQYKNPKEYPVSGKLHLYYNENKYNADNFELVEVRTYHGEKVEDENPLLAASFYDKDMEMLWASTASDAFTVFIKDSTERNDLNHTLQESNETYRESHVLEFYDMEPKEARNLYFVMKTTPEMLQDTSAIINIRGVFVPDRQLNNHRVQDLEMEITTSHDPNKMAVYDTRVNYRFFPGKKLDYKVRFQNNGEGPAKTIRLEIDVPPTMDQTSLEVTDLYPECPICPDEQEVDYSCLDSLFMEDKMVLTFKNVHLPGSRQKGVEEYDSTKGFVKYRLMMKEKVPKVNSVSRTAIIFDKNEPILTNYTRTRFKPGLSIGILGGYTAQPSLQESRNYNLGITFSPFKPHKGFFQFELIASRGMYEEMEFSESRRVIDPTFPDLEEVIEVTDYQQIKDVGLTLVPVSYRYNLAKILSIGAGVQVSTKLIEDISGQRDYDYFVQFQGGDKEPNPDMSRSEPIEEHNTFVGFIPGVFADLNLGSVRIGPTAGFRYIYQIEQPSSQLMFYLIWKL